MKAFRKFRSSEIKVALVTAGLLELGLAGAGSLSAQGSCDTKPDCGDISFEISWCQWADCDVCCSGRNGCCLVALGHCTDGSNPNPVMFSGCDLGPFCNC